MDTIAYDLQLGDHVVFEVEGRLELSDAMCALFVGGPSQTVDGRILVTEQRLVFCPVVGQAYPQRVDLARDPAWQIDTRRRRWFGFLARGEPVVQVAFRMAHRDVVMVFHVPDPDSFIAALRQPPPQAAAPRALLAAALAARVRERGCYTRVLQALSFPAGFWHTEALDDLVEIVVSRFRELDIELDDTWVRGLDLEVEPVTGPEDYETGPGSEAWARKDQIERICVAANALLTGPRRFHAFAEDLPGWEFDEPVWLFLDEDERRSLLELGIIQSR